ncbi:MAG TPA: hypothetical protein VJ890_13780 [Vineibacter sp.]|nr:hypothetical protein [Vineibacter sp.]
MSDLTQTADTTDALRKLQSTSSTWLRVSMAVAVAILLLFGGVLWKLDILNLQGTSANVKIIAATLALMGALVGSLVTLVGLTLKHSIDQRTFALQLETEARRRTESDRNSRLQKEAEDRLKVEAAIRAIGLLSTTSGQEIPPTQKAGVILALSDLGIFPLALSLTDQMLRRTSFDPGTACWLFNKALASKDLDVRQQAARLTAVHVDKMLLKEGRCVFPAILQRDEIASLEKDVRQTCVHAQIDLLLLRPFSEWNPDIFAGMLDCLLYAWKHDEDGDIRADAGAAVRTFLRAFDPNQEFVLRIGSRRIGGLAAELALNKEQQVSGRMVDGRLRSLALDEWEKQLGSSYVGEGKKV